MKIKLSVILPLAATALLFCSSGLSADSNMDPHHYGQPSTEVSDEQAFETSATDDLNLDDGATDNLGWWSWGWGYEWPSYGFLSYPYYGCW